MSFKDMVSADIRNVFLNPAEFAEKRTVVYDGSEYRDIPVVLTSIKENDRRQLTDDHAQGLYKVSHTLHCALTDVGGILPEKGACIQINDAENGGGFFRKFYIAIAGIEEGMICLKLEAIDE